MTFLTMAERLQVRSVEPFFRTAFRAAHDDVMQRCGAESILHTHRSCLELLLQVGHLQYSSDTETVLSFWKLVSTVSFNFNKLDMPDLPNMIRVFQHPASMRWILSPQQQNMWWSFFQFTCGTAAITVYYHNCDMDFQTVNVSRLRPTI